MKLEVGSWKLEVGSFEVLKFGHFSFYMKFLVLQSQSQSQSQSQLQHSHNSFHAVLSTVKVRDRCCLSQNVR